MVILFTVVTIKNRRRGESMSGIIWRRTAKDCIKIRPIRRFRELCDLGPRSRNDLDLQYTQIFVLNLISFRSQAAIVSEKSTVFTFSHGKAQVTKFDCVVKYYGQGHSRVII